MRTERKGAELRCRAMGADVHVIVVGGPPGLARSARERIDDLERRWSRFIPDSEVNRLNRRSGESVTVSPETVQLVERSTEAWRLTGGSFDPTVLGDVIRAGYDRSFDEVSSFPAIGLSSFTIGCADIQIEGCGVRLPEGTGFDPGGIGKGLAADLVSGEIMAGGAEGVCVNLGGDLRARGNGPGDGPWTVAVEHPWSEQPVARLGLTSGAVATSTTLTRRWRNEAGMRHHLIDPGTGEPSDTDLTLATVVCASGWEAEVLAKAVLLRGSAHPFDLLGGTGAEAVVVDDAGRIASSAGLAAFLGPAGLPAAVAAPDAGARR